MRKFVIGLAVLFVVLAAMVACGGTTETDDPTEVLPYEIPSDPTETEDIYEPIPVEIPQHNEYIVTLEIDPETRTVQGISRISFTNRSDTPLDTIVLRVFLNAFDESVEPRPYTEDARWRLAGGEGTRGRMDIEYVFINNEVPDFEMDGTILTLRLDAPVEPGVTVLLSLQFSAYVPPFRHIIGGNDDAMWFGMFLPVLAVYDENGWHTEAFYPVGNPFFLETANYQVAITTPIDYNVVGTGHRTEEIIYDTDIKITRFAANMTRDFAFAVLFPAYYSASIMTESGVEVVLHHHTAVTDDRMEDILNFARVSVESFETHVGVYPFGQINIVETDMVHDNMHFSQMVFFDGRLLRSGNLQGLAHSLGSQWFASVVGVNAIAEPWLDIGLTRFVQAKIALETPELLREYMEQVHTRVAERTDLYLTDGLWAYTSREDFIMAQGYRAMLMLHQLQHRMGAEDFWTFINLYYQTFSFQIASVQDFIATAAAVYGNDLQEFFHVWMTSDVVPPLLR